jgi:hypothetical protein
MEKVSLSKTVRAQNTYTSVIDTEFTELITPVELIVEPTVTVERFFELYDQLFFDIPVDGELNSHRYLVERSTQYLGGSQLDNEKQALIEEINALRLQLIELGGNVIDINNISI